MILHVAYVLHSNDLGGRVLGVRTHVEQAKKLCQEYYNLQRGEGAEQHLDWITYSDSEAKGWQAQGSVPQDCYYVEESEIDILTRSGDEIHNGMDWKDRLILQKTIENGHLAESVVTQHNNIKPLEERIDQLCFYIDRLLYDAGYKTYTFTGIDGTQELWEVKKRE